MDNTALLNLIQADPALTTKAEAGDCLGVAAALNTPSIAVKVQYQFTTLKAMDILGPTRGTQVMTALRADSSYGEIVKLMDIVDAGVNLNHPDADSMFAQLVTSSILTQAESDQILALRNTMVSKAEQTLGMSVTHLDVAAAWAGRS